MCCLVIQEAYRQQFRGFMSFVDQQRQLPVLKQFLKLYTTISLPKLAGLMDTDEAAVKEQLRVLEVSLFPHGMTPGAMIPDSTIPDAMIPGAMIPGAMVPDASQNCFACRLLAFCQNGRICQSQLCYQAGFTASSWDDSWCNET